MVPETQVAKAALEGIITKTVEDMAAMVAVIRTVVETHHHRNVMAAKMVVALVEDITTTTIRIREEAAETIATITRVDGHRAKEVEDRARVDLEAVLFVAVEAAIAVEEEAVVVLEDHRPVDMVVAVVDLTILTSGKYREHVALLNIRVLFFSYLNYQPWFITDNPTYCLLFRFVLCNIPINVSI